MAFVPVNFGSIAKFNSATSSKLIQMYEEALDAQISEESVHPKSKTFAPSSIRCPRISWFRLRGVQPDIIKKPDRILEFSAVVGTACHEMIQKTLITRFKDDWISVEDHLKEINPNFKYTIKQDGYETKVHIEDPPIKFAVDGIIRIDGIKYLLEIKSSDYGSWKQLSDPKPKHIDQVTCYASMLNLDRVLMIYIDRVYGDIKCFELPISLEARQNIWKMFEYVQHMVDCNLAPERLPSGDSWCTASMCSYYEKCKQW